MAQDKQKEIRKNERVAIYPGSFDPITNGHLDVIKRALKVFDRLIVAVGNAPDKKSLFSVHERVKMIKECTKDMHVDVESFDGLLVDYAKKKNCNMIVRSLRAVSDFDYEFQMVVMNKQLMPELEAVFLMTDKEYFFLSSTAVKEIAKGGGDINKLVPANVAKMLKLKFNSKMARIITKR